VTPNAAYMLATALVLTAGSVFLTKVAFRPLKSTLLSGLVLVVSIICLEAAVVCIVIATVILTH